MQIADKDYKGKVFYRISPFASKSVENGDLFRRKHGFSSQSIAPGQSVNIELTVPYNLVKINQIEFCNTNEGDECSFRVYDNASGTISTIPNQFLNQFGFNVRMPGGFYRDVSEYDADLILGMKIIMEYKNNGTDNKVIFGNITYHEIKS